MDEREAILRLKRGDISGLEELVRAHQVRAVRAAYLVTRDLALAQDVVQTAFVRAYERIDQFDTSRPFEPWFLKSMLRDAVKAAVRRERHTPIEAQLETAHNRFADPSSGPEALWEQAETADEIADALNRLLPNQRAAIVSRYFLGLTEHEMAESLEVPRSTVKWRLHAARQRLRLLLQPLMTEQE